MMRCMSPDRDHDCAASACQAPAVRRLPGLAARLGVWRLALAVGLLAAAAPAMACNCFSPELRLKTGRETLQLAQLAVFGTVVALDTDGTARIEVLESFKGPAKGEAVTLQAGAPTCTTPMPPVGRQVLVIGFEQALSACTQYEADHFLLDAFRHIAAHPR